MHMQSKFEKILSESLGLPVEAKEMIQEAWNEQLSEAKTLVEAELRAEFAQKFEYDKGVLVESMDKFLSDKIRAELEEFAQDKKDLVAERVKYKKGISEHIEMLDKFVTEQIAKEIKELRSDRVKAMEGVKKLEGFMIKQLTEEIKEFHSDKKALVEQKVKMIKEGKQELVKTKRMFIKEAAEAVEKNIDAVLRKEISQYRDDITAARNNEFGRRMFETFVGEYMSSYLNEGSELKRLQKVLEAKDAEVKKLNESLAQKEALVESAKKDLSSAQKLHERNQKISSMTAHLSKGKQDVMKELLESVKTENLQAAFDKYLPAVLNETVAKKPSKGILSESKVEKTGDRAPSVAHDASSANDIAEIVRLAGIKKSS